MTTVQRISSDDTPAYGSMALRWQADDAWVVSEPAALRNLLDDLPPAERLAVEVAGELTNTVVTDHVPGRLVLFRDGTHTDVTTAPDGRVLLEVDASRALDDVVADAVAQGLTGIEMMSGVPGTIGGAVVQNAGAYGQAISDVFVRATAYRRTDAAIVTLQPADLRFGYRTSRLKAAPGFSPDLLVLRVVVGLRRTAPAPITYDDLARHHTSLGRADDDLAARRASVLEVRATKGMVVGGDHWRPSVGSFFVGAAVSREVAIDIATRVRGEAFARRFLDWYRPDGTTPRLPAALVLRAAGFVNGDHWGKVGLSERHVLALCNRGGATGTDVLAVSGLVRRQVAERLGIDLEPEPKTLGEMPDLDLDAYAAAHPYTPGAGEPDWARATSGG